MAGDEAARPPEPDELIVRFLDGRDVPCPGCGYNLRGLKTSACPECRQELRLTVQLAEMLTGPYIGALSGLLAAAGASLVCLTIAAWVSWRWGPPGRQEFLWVVVLPAIVLLLDGTATLLLVPARGRRWFRRLRGPWRLVTILACWAQVGVFVGIFLWGIG